MRIILILMLLVPFKSNASFLFNYGLNYSSEKEDSDDNYEKTRTFHKLLLGASVNNRRTLFFGWNINSWSSSISRNSLKDTYSLTEMGPRMLWFTNDQYRWFFSLEWNPYVRGKRNKADVSRKITGSSFGAGFGYRYRISRLIGLGASINWHQANFKEEKIGSTETNISDSISHVMPMLELSILTK